MKMIYLLFIVNFILGCSASEPQIKKEKVTINGKVNAANFTKLMGSHSLSFTENIEIGQGGQFSYTPEIDGPTFISFSFPGYNRATMIAEPGKVYNVEINIMQRDVKVNVLGNAAGLNKMYSSFYSPGYISMGLPGMSSSTKNETIHKMFDPKFQNEKDQLDEAKSNGVLSESVYKLILTDRENFYKARKATIAYRKSRGRDQMDERTVNLWNEIYDGFEPTEWDRKSIWYYENVQGFLRSKRYIDPSYTKLNDDQFEKGEQRFEKLFEASKQFLTKENQSQYIAEYLSYALNKAKPEKKVVATFKKYKSQYGKSPSMPMLKSKVAKAEEYFKLIESPFEKGVDFIKQPELINSLHELLGQFKGQKVYIDVWASWCGPCKREFKFKENLVPVLEKYNVAPLYISIDKPNKIQAWEETIKVNRLKGNHIRASQFLAADLQRYYGGGLRIPYYILINEEGKIAVNHAARPSNIQELESQIQSML